VRPTGHDDLDELLETVQNHLHVVQADLANPDPDPDDPAIEAAHVETLEARIDALDEELEPLRSFILPPAAARRAPAHHARTVTRRAERRVVELARSEPINEMTVTYLNRLSDLLFHARSRRERARRRTRGVADLLTSLSCASPAFLPRFLRFFDVQPRKDGFRTNDDAIASI